MKKFILLAFAMILATSCDTDKINGIQLKKGDTKTYETKDYLIIYEIDGFTGAMPCWKFKEIINKKIPYEKDTLISTHHLDDDRV